jgi:NAD(P)-dependent dehydrogenase (short-subunit alcohol dehydrogenase family)
MSFERVAIFGATSAIAQATSRPAGKARSPACTWSRATRRSWRPSARTWRRAARAPSPPRSPDLDDPSRHAALVDAAIEALGGLDAALIAQGILPDQAEAARDPAIARRSLHTNFVAPALLIGVLAERLEARGAGTLVRSRRSRATGARARITSTAAPRQRSRPTSTGCAAACTPRE